MRAFIALELPDELIDELGNVVHTLAATTPGRYIPRANYHLTLAFLGEIDESEARCAIDVLDKASAGRSEPLLILDGLGTFGKDRNTTLWVGVRATSEIITLGAYVRQELDQQGIYYDRKPLRPHITIARKVQLGEMVSFRTCHPAPAPRITLFRSILNESGATYQPLYSASLCQQGKEYLRVYTLSD